jgi:hypothetical protein
LLGALKFGGPSNYSEFEDDGTLRFNGGATVWNDINLPSTNLRPGLSPPSFAAVLASGGLYGFTFSATTLEELHGSGEILHGYKEGTDLHCHVHWMPTTTNNGVVRWGLEYAWVDVNGVAGAPAIIYFNQAASGTVWQHHLAPLPTITGTGRKIGSAFIFRIFRDAANIADTYTGQAYLLQFGIHYEIDTVGSREIATK